MDSKYLATKQSTSRNREMFRPPVNRAMRVLDRSFFKKTVPVSAATVLENKNISSVRKRLESSKDAIDLPRYNTCATPTSERLVVGRNGQILELTKEESRKKKCLVLREDIKYDDATTWSPILNELVENGTVGLGPYTIDLDYSYWTYAEIIEAILPEEEVASGEFPEGFTLTGHVLHLNLRERWYPYKHLIAQILKDKNPLVRTVINKTENVGSESEFRTFPFEILAGENDLNVTVHEQGCEFRFDFSRVYWNSRLETEHRRLCDKFHEGELVCDVMAGVGPFAVPAGKKKIFVWANDLNPHGWESMEDAVKRNKVQQFVKPFNMDGRKFIRASAEMMLSPPTRVVVQPKVSNSARRNKPAGAGRTTPPPPQIYTRPSTVDHYVMNLPATAIEFLDAFVGVYAGMESRFEPFKPERKLPVIHVYCFSGHSEDVRDDHEDICRRISERMGFTLTPDDTVNGTGNQERELEIHNVRLVSPKKQMFCASFRLPKEVAFAR
ncbi:tRNA (guanine) methyltransferase Trm5 [Talaromyces stipitatus ATCC 10500]|uniref:tRNA (guanine(37)-N1)-methyltransferase n=1 Tax=Talaromyces stipitatus (strain ATCC 10500 / CBS 375.48 / QM 6759 / NRRL 1006) TaxID=441959 RepID=B8MTF6_TALSN|nr:tRNA (guanine) methyltransferase Trm5 [Talaromyces stipitatus ATCC 10500]EED12288.1 tRNA (guanine) methyltransferase Trm5 [Talaromyces stipitatus ATCC 10500]